MKTLICWERGKERLVFFFISRVFKNLSNFLKYCETFSEEGILVKPNISLLIMTEIYEVFLNMGKLNHSFENFSSSTSCENEDGLAERGRCVNSS